LCTVETPHERLDRNFSDLLQEVRVAQTGVQILFAFLLTLPFSARFGQTLPGDRIIYVIILIAAAIASALLIAPVSYHRLVFRQNRKAEPVRTASQLAEAGTVCLLIAIVGAVLVVIDVVVNLPAAIVIAAAIAITCTALWYPSSGPASRRSIRAATRPRGGRAHRDRPRHHRPPTPARCRTAAAGSVRPPRCSAGTCSGYRRTRRWRPWTAVRRSGRG